MGSINMQDIDDTSHFWTRFLNKTGHAYSTIKENAESIGHTLWVALIGLLFTYLLVKICAYLFLPRNLFNLRYFEGVITVLFLICTLIFFIVNWSELVYALNIIRKESDNFIEIDESDGKRQDQDDMTRSREKKNSSDNFANNSVANNFFQSTLHPLVVYFARFTFALLMIFFFANLVLKELNYAYFPRVVAEKNGITTLLIFGTIFIAFEIYEKLALGRHSRQSGDIFSRSYVNAYREQLRESRALHYVFMICRWIFIIAIALLISYFTYVISLTMGIRLPYQMILIALIFVLILLAGKKILLEE